MQTHQPAAEGEANSLPPYPSVDMTDQSVQCRKKVKYTAKITHDYSYNYIVGCFDICTTSDQQLNKVNFFVLAAN